VIADSTAQTLSEYLETSDMPGGSVTSRRSMELFYGGDFWHNKDSWLRYDPILNADRIATPAMFIDNGAWQQEIKGRSTRGAFKYNNKPIEYIYIQKGGHILHRPAERIAAQERGIDWLSYWLKGEVDTSPAKAEEYARWAPLREQQKKIIAESRRTDRPLPALPELKSVTFWPDRQTVN
jgi:hypothetical protein